jgi:hypothetical protein
MQRLKWFVLVVVLALVLGVVEAAPAAAAKGANNAGAKACQRGGWQALVARTGEAFKNQGDCVNDGAQGNSPFGTYGKAACAAVSGTFNQDNTKVWQCHFSEGNPPNFNVLNTVSNASDLDTNGLGDFTVSGTGQDVDGFCTL